MFLARDLTRHDVRELVQCGLRETRGNYRGVVTLFNLPESDYKKFMNFLSHARLPPRVPRFPKQRDSPRADVARAGAGVRRPRAAGRSPRQPPRARRLLIGRNRYPEAELKRDVRATMRRPAYRVGRCTRAREPRDGPTARRLSRSHDRPSHIAATTADIEFYARESPSAAFVSSSMVGWRLVGRGADRWNRGLRRLPTHLHLPTPMSSPASVDIRQWLKHAHRLAASDVKMLITGENGVLRHVFARYIVASVLRRVPLSCLTRRGQQA